MHASAAWLGVQCPRTHGIIPPRMTSSLSGQLAPPPLYSGSESDQPALRPPTPPLPSRECKNRLTQSTKQKLRKDGFKDKRVLTLEDLADPLREVRQGGAQ